MALRPLRLVSLASAVIALVLLVGCNTHAAPVVSRQAEPENVRWYEPTGSHRYSFVQHESAELSQGRTRTTSSRSASMTISLTASAPSAGGPRTLTFLESGFSSLRTSSSQPTAAVESSDTFTDSMVVDRSAKWIDVPEPIVRQQWSVRPVGQSVVWAWQVVQPVLSGEKLAPGSSWDATRSLPGQPDVEGHFSYRVLSRGFSKRVPVYRIRMSFEASGATVPRQISITGTQQGRGLLLVECATLETVSAKVDWTVRTSYTAKSGGEAFSVSRNTLDWIRL